MDSPPKTWPIGLFVGAMFCLFAGVWWFAFTGMSVRPVRDMFDLTVMLFEGFWLLGWSVGVVFLGALTVLLLFAPATVGSRAELVGGLNRFARSPRSPEVPRAASEAKTAPLPLTSPSGLALVFANLIPLAGVLFFNWDLASVIVLFWAESAVIGFYTILKLVFVAKLGAVFTVPYFAAHFGAFMAMHLGFIYMLFVRGIGATGPDVALRDALLATFRPIGIPLIALVVSHGVSFATNFIGRREYEATTSNALMSAPYGRIVIMQLVVIFGGWIIMALGDPRPALALLVVAKIVADFAAHRKEHGVT